MSNAFERAVKRGNAQLFGEVTIRNQSAMVDAEGEPQQDAYGTIIWADATETDVPGEVVYRGTPSFDRRADGIDDDITVIVWVDDSETMTSGSDDEATRATRVITDDGTYVIRDVFDERNGRVRGHGAPE